MYAVIKAGGHQYKASVGDELIVERLPYEVGTQVELGEVYLLAAEDGVSVGHPTVVGAKVRATVLDELGDPRFTSSSTSQRSAIGAEWAIDRPTCACALMRSLKEHSDGTEEGYGIEWTR